MSKVHLFQEAVETRPSVPRIFKQLRQRARVRFEADLKAQSARRQTGRGEMAEAFLEGEQQDPRDHHQDRTTLCLPSFTKDSILHAGEDGYKDVLREYFPSAESNASERLVDLKRRLRKASTHDFWRVLIEEMCEIVGAQCGFVAKRVLVDDQNTAVEMPELGEPGSCLMGVAFHINDGANFKETYRDYQYAAYGTPCAHMKHDKVFIVPARMKEVITDNPNKMPWDESDAFIGVPLFHDDKCFAHIGMVWSSEGSRRRKLSWNFIEMFIHSLEDMILQRILEGKGFAKDATASETAPTKVIPLAAISASQSLKPYARSLSHELRTPMQGVVGMIDLMSATIENAIEMEQSEAVRQIFQEIKSLMEDVQDSSKRAIEAADNVVHAYDVNLEMPETPLTPAEPSSGFPSRRHSPERGRDNLSASTGRKRAASEDIAPHFGPPLKKMFSMSEVEIVRLYSAKSPPAAEAVGSSTLEMNFSGTAPGEKRRNGSNSPILAPTQRHVIIRDFVRRILLETLRSGRPMKETRINTDSGERFEVQTTGDRGELQNIAANLEFADGVPESVITEERDLQYCIQKVIDNAIKFTGSGTVTVVVRLGDSPHTIEFLIADTGCGIAEEAKAELFKPHFQQDSSRQRPKEGLGLSLFNAKAQARSKLGGDLILERSETEGLGRGSTFLIRLPISAHDVETEIPIVGTPPAFGHQNSRFPWTEINLPTSVITKPARPGTLSPPSGPVSHDSQFSPSRSTSRKQLNFNPTLVDDYPLNIMVAEDNAINRRVMIGSLKKLGYTETNLKVAFDGLEAVKYYEESLRGPPEKRFDAIFMDIWMPNMDGYKATKRINELAQANGETITVMAVTADITNSSSKKAKECGMHGFLAKPYKVCDIETLIKDHFPKRLE